MVEAAGSQGGTGARGAGRFSYVAEPTDVQVSVREGGGARVPLSLDGAPVAWPPVGGLRLVGQAVFAHLTGITWPRPPLPGRLVAEVLQPRYADQHLRVEAREARDWLLETAPDLVHDALPELAGASSPPPPPATLEALMEQSGRDAVRRITVARGIYANHPWHADWLPATGEVLSVMHTGPDPAQWAVARILANVPVADALHLTTDPPSSLGHLVERLNHLSSTGGPTGADGPATRQDAP